MNFPHWSRLTIRTRLTVVIGLILVLFFLATNLISFRVSTSALRHTILENELPLTSSNIYSEIQTDLLRPILISSFMANDTFLKDWMLEGEKNRDSLTRYLDQTRRHYDSFTSYLISARTLTYYHFTGATRPIVPTDPADAWVFRDEKMPAPYEVNVGINKDLKDEMTIFVNCKVLDYQGKFIGIVGIGLNPRSIASVMTRYQEKYQRDIYFIDSRGDIIARSSGADVRGDNILTAPGISVIGKRVLAIREGYFEYTRDGEHMLLTTRSIPDLGWHVIVEQRESDAFRSLWYGFLTNIAVGLIGITLTILIMSYAVNIYQHRLEQLAVTDRLTGTGNRQVFEQALELALRRMDRGKRSYGLIMFDLDRFKDINDQLGHLKGDEAIRRASHAAIEVLSSPGMLYRWGGEEFCVMIPDCEMEDVLELAERLRASIQVAPLFVPDTGQRITVSVGATMLVLGDTAQTAVHRVDAALYRAKMAGRNCVRSDEDDEGIAS